MENSIYHQVASHISKGILENNFSLPDEDGSQSPLKFAPGALDGMCLYHMRRGELDAEAEKQMAEALEEAAKGNFPKADALFHEWTKDHRTISYIDDFQNYVRAHAQELDPGNVHSVALAMVLHSEHIECVKVGLALFELFTEPNERLKVIIRDLGLYDEFTVFSVWNMQRWENGNQEIFSLAKKTHSWGRIHAVECLVPETEEIRHWLLTEGTVNDVVNAYSSLTCWQKAGAEEILFGQPAPDEFEGLTTLIEGLLDEGPVPGISRLENAEAVLMRFLAVAPNYSLTADDYDTILSVREWAENKDSDLTSVIEACDRILHSAACTASIEEAVKEGRALRLAEALDIPYLDQMLACMERDFDGNYPNVRYLLADPAYVEPALKLYLEELPLAEMKGDPIDDPCLGAEYKDFDKLQYLIQELDDKPLTGCEFIKAALESPVSRNRYRALAVLQAWVEAKGTALSELNPELNEAVSLLEWREIVEGNLKMIEALLAGETRFSADSGE